MTLQLLSTLLLLAPLWCVQAQLHASIEPSDHYFLIGSKAELECSVQNCSDSPKITWHLQADLEASNITNNDTRSTLTFDSVSKEHCGEVACHVACGEEEVSAVTSVKVYSSPSAPDIFGSLVVNEGASSSLLCRVQGMYPPELFTVEWLRGNETLNNHTGNSGDVRIWNQVEFEPKREDAEEDFICRATMDLPQLPLEERTWESSVRLDVHYAPNITSVSDEVQMMAGSSVTLNCSADGNPSPSFSWSFSHTKEECEESTSPEESEAVGSGSELALDSVTVSQTGLYQCTASNTEGNVKSTPVKVTVHAAPTTMSLTVSTEEDGRKITCKTDGAPLPEIVLKKGGEELERKNCTHTLSYTFTAEDVQEDTVFECEATNEHGSVTESATVHPIVPNPLPVSVEPSDLYFLIGSKAELVCSVQNCSDSPKITWHLQKKQLSESTITTKGDQSTLTFDPVKEEHRGDLSCRATCEEGEGSTESSLQVYSLPSAPPQTYGSLVVSEGVSSFLLCKIEGMYPPELLTLDWLRGNETLDSHTGKPGDVRIWNELEFEPKREDAEEDFTCRATMDLPQLPLEERTWESSIRLDVHYPPNITSVSDTVHVLVGSNSTLNCSADGHPSPSFSWSFSHISEGCEPGASPEYEPVGLDFELELDSLTVSHTGLYQCTASNTEGKAKSLPVHVTVHVLPTEMTVTVGPEDEEKKRTITCESDGTPPPEMVLKKNGEELERKACTHTLSHTFQSEVQEATEFECEAIDHFGSITKSVTVEPIEPAK